MEVRGGGNFHLCYKNQSVYAVSGTSRCLFSDKYKTHKYSGQSVQLLNVELVVHHVTSRLSKVGQVPYKELHSDRTTNLGTKEEVKLSCPRREGTQGGAEVWLQ